MNKRARDIVNRSSKEVNLVWTGDALPAALIRNITIDITNELSKLKYQEMTVENIIRELKDIYE